jgi:hypothetical protein
MEVHSSYDGPVMHVPHTDQISESNMEDVLQTLTKSNNNNSYIRN